MKRLIPEEYSEREKSVSAELMELAGRFNKCFRNPQVFFKEKTNNGEKKTLKNLDG